MPHTFYRHIRNGSSRRKCSAPLYLVSSEICGGDLSRSSVGHQPLGRARRREEIFEQPAHVTPVVPPRLLQERRARVRHVRDAADGHRADEDVAEDGVVDAVVQLDAWWAGMASEPHMRPVWRGHGWERPWASREGLSSSQSVRLGRREAPPGGLFRLGLTPAHSPSAAAGMPTAS